MWKTLAIDFVAPPFGGHLFPLLELAGFLRDRGMTRLRIVSTPAAAPAVTLSGLHGAYLLTDRQEAIRRIANPPYPVSGHPGRLYRQFKANMDLMGAFRDQLQVLWKAHRPDLVVADFTVPVAGLLARELGIRWWTSTPSPCAIETRTATPSYLGGWTPGTGFRSRLRDAAGRQLIRGFKRGMGWWFRDAFRSLHIPGVYRPDGEEVLYSPERILGLGMEAFEFPRDWPSAFTFIGPLTASPPFPHVPPAFRERRRHVLVSLGTHLPWAKEPAARFVERVAAAIPDVCFHFTYGAAGTDHHRAVANVAYHAYLPYDTYLPRYDAALVHGGTGIVYSCIRAGVPMLVWPHDYDHFDHAARIVRHGLGLRLRPRLPHAVESLRRLMTDAAFARRMERFREELDRYTPGSTVLGFLQALAP